MNYATFATLVCIVVGAIYGFNGNKDAAYMFMLCANVWAAADFARRGK